MTAHEEVLQLRETIKGLETTIQTHNASASELATAKARVTELESEAVKLKTDHTSAISALNLSVSNLTARAEKAEAELKSEKEGFEKKVALRAQEILAGTGAPAIPARATEKPSTVATVDTSKLTGLAKAIAIHTAEQSKRN